MNIGEYPFTLLGTIINKNLNIISCAVNSKLIKQKIEYSICPKCEETYSYLDLKNGLCPKCNIKTENLDGYYDKQDKGDNKS